jgi:hypothetical protein
MELYGMTTGSTAAIPSIVLSIQDLVTFQKMFLVQFVS